MTLCIDEAGRGCLAGSLSVSLWAAFASDKIILSYWGNKLGRRYLTRVILEWRLTHALSVI